LDLKYLLPRIPFNHEHFVDIIYFDGHYTPSFSPIVSLSSTSVSFLDALIDPQPGFLALTPKSGGLVRAVAAVTRMLGTRSA
jgi:hypothetical protein